MPEETTPAAPQTAPGTAIQGRAEIVTALRGVLLSLPQRGVAEVSLADEDFADWPLDEPAVLDALTVWARPAGRSLRFIGRQFDILLRHRPRLARWRRDWAHKVQAWSPPESWQPPMPCCLLAGLPSLQIIDAEQGRARWLLQQGELHLLHEQIDAVLPRCEAAWPASTLGL